jgi:hypothetical protein
MPTVHDRPDAELMIYAARAALLASHVERNAQRRPGYIREAMLETATRLRQSDVSLRTLARLSDD